MGPDRRGSSPPLRFLAPGKLSGRLDALGGEGDGHSHPDADGPAVPRAGFESPPGHGSQRRGLEDRIARMLHIRVLHPPFLVDDEHDADHAGRPVAHLIGQLRGGLTDDARLLVKVARNEDRPAIIGERRTVVFIAGGRARLGGAGLGVRPSVILRRHEGSQKSGDKTKHCTCTFHVYDPFGKVIGTIMRNRTGWPFRLPGSNFHCLTAANAALSKIGSLELRTRGVSTRPRSSTMKMMWTFPGVRLRIFGVRVGPGW